MAGSSSLMIRYKGRNEHLTSISRNQVVVYDAATYHVKEGESGYPYQEDGSDFRVVDVITDDDGTFDEPQYVVVIEHKPQRLRGITDLRLEVQLVDFAQGNQYLDVAVRTDVPTEAGPWMPTVDDLSPLESILWVFKDFMAALTGGPEGTNEESNFYHARTAFYVDDVEVLVMTSDPDGMQPDTKRVLGVDAPVAPENN